MYEFFILGIGIGMGIIIGIIINLTKNSHISHISKKLDRNIKRWDIWELNTKCSFRINDSPNEPQCDCTWNKGGLCKINYCPTRL